MLGKKIFELRKSANLTQKMLATIIGVTPQAVSLWEKDLADPDLLNIKALANYFQISLDELLEMENYNYSFEYQHNNTKLIHKEKNKGVK